MSAFLQDSTYIQYLNHTPSIQMIKISPSQGNKTVMDCKFLANHLSHITDARKAIEECRFHSVSFARE